MRDEGSEHGVQHALRGQAACKMERCFACCVALQARGDQGAAWAAKVLNDIKIWPLVQPRNGRPGKHHHLVQRVHSQIVLGRKMFLRRWSNNVREKAIEGDKIRHEREVQQIFGTEKQEGSDGTRPQLLDGGVQGRVALMVAQEQLHLEVLCNYE